MMLLVVVQLRRGAVGDERAAAGEQLEGALEARAAEVVEDGVDAVGRELADRSDRSRVVVVDGFGAQLA